MINRERILHFSIILIAILAYFNPWIDMNTFPARGDAPDIEGVFTSDLTALIGIYPLEERKVIEEYHQFPFWSPWRLGGTPIFAKPQAVFFYINLPLLLYAPTIFAAIKWSVLLHFFIAAISMYALMHYLSKNNFVSFVSSIIYIFNGYIVSRLNWGQTNIIYPYAWFPLIFLLTFLAIENKEWILKSMLAGVLFGFLVLSGGAQIFSYFAIIYFYFVVIYYLLHFSKESFLEMSLRIFLIGIVICTVFFGLTAVFILPNSELMKGGVRNEGFSYEQSVGGKMNIDWSFFVAMMQPTIFKKPLSDWNSTGFGFLPFLLILPGLFYFRKKKVMLFVLLTIATILVFRGSFLYRVFWDIIPQFRQVKGIFKGHAIIYFLLTILAGYGFLFFTKMIDRLKHKKAIQWAFAALILINLTIFNNTMTTQTSVDYELSKNNILQFIAKDKDIFRFYIYETRGIDWGTDRYNVPLNLHDVFGTENVWLVEYLPIYLSQANAFPAKLYGILNTKYITSKDPINVSGYRLIKEFEGCGNYPNGMEICQPRKSDGKYLYFNEGFLPRAYSAKKSILVIGNENDVMQMGYFILEDPNYNPVTTVVIFGKGKIQDYDPSFLKNIDMIFLTRDSVDAESSYNLDSYSKHGVLVPNVVNGENKYDFDMINRVLFNFSNNRGYSSVDKNNITYYSPNEIIIDTKNKEGFLVLSEQFSFYKNWRAFGKDGKEKKIYRANGVISTVLMEDDEFIRFEYVDEDFKKGAIMGVITLIIILTYFVWTKKEAFFGLFRMFLNKVNKK